MDSSKAIDFTVLMEKLPPIIWRSRWNELAEKIGLPYRRTYLENLDALDRGPKKSFLNKRVAYRREDVVEWLNAMQGKK